MAKVTMPQSEVKEILKAVPHLVKFPIRKMWSDYDEEADVLYISFERPQKATDSEMLESGVLLRYRNKKLVGLTILEASKR
jgi:uncharacterized protein YuzE